jgi:hypothetical protein
VQNSSPRRDAARFPGHGNQRAGGTHRHSQTTNTTAVHQYTMPLPLTAALLTDAWPQEVLLSLRLHRALARLVAALSEWEVRP